MSRHRFYAPPSSIEGDQITLGPEESYHLWRVLRMRPGAIVYVFDGTGWEYACQLQGGDHQRARLNIVERQRPPVESPLAITLAQGLAKGEKFELVVQKATELGVHRIIPLITAHTLSTGIREVSEHRLRRWRRIALEATKQCGRTRLPEILAPLRWEAFLRAFPQPALLFAERAGRSLADVARAWSEGVDTLCLLIGPEGGWQESEVAAAQTAGAIVVTLGQRILRTETAALVAISVVQHLWGDLR